MLLLGKKKEELYFSSLGTIQVDFNLPKELQTQIEMIGLTELDVKRLFVLQPIIEREAQQLVDSFYETIGKEPSLITIINTYSNVEKLGKTLYHHIKEIFSGKVNESYVMQRKRIAHVHVKIGLGTKWYVNAFQQLLNTIIEVFYKEIQNKAELFEAVRSLQKIFSLEQQLVLESYELREESLRKVKESEKEKIQGTMRETAHELSAISEETSASLKELISQFEKIQILTKDGGQAIQIVEKLSEDGKIRMGQEKESASSIKNQIFVLQDEISKMSMVSQRIDSVVDVVTSIANQINLLALNASIESARAGEHGKGFAVVAGEIRKLSSLTKQSTEEIGSLVKDISQQVKQVHASVTDFNQGIVENQKITEETIEFFNQIVQAVQQSKEKTEIIFTEIKNSDLIVNQLYQATNEITHSAEMLAN
ncbi:MULTISPECIES: protoglobin domain-containing protein [unclassified Niallia]|uniref:protoglobin domain-containing protein n=1 Tax=unclassified Niallia TaxID=2837522 RepID=UPI0003180BFA